MSISGENGLLRMGKISFGGVVKDICLGYVPEAKEGEYVIVHAGFALSVLDETEAEKVFEELRKIEALTAEEPEQLE